jgi:hypothetical protein
MHDPPPPPPATTRYETEMPAIGVELLEAVDHAPWPAPFTAATRNTYAVPLFKEVTVALVVAEVSSLNVVHVDPESDEYWTM